MTNPKNLPLMKRISKIEKLDAYNEHHSRTAIQNMHYKDHPPMFVAAVGPAKSGKTAFCTKLVSHYAGESIVPQGPVTFKSKGRRFTLYECECSIENMIDTIKVADLVVLTVNLDYGLEKETLEAIAMILSHGLTKIMVMYTSTDAKRSAPARKAVQHRISQEFSFVFRSFDLKQDSIEKIARNLELMKTRPLEWKSVHPHVVVDKQDGEYVYGYVRGGPFKPKTQVHVPGQGNFMIDDIVEIADPCNLKLKNQLLYNPSGKVLHAEEESSCSEHLDLATANVQLFDGGDNRGVRGLERSCRENAKEGFCIESTLTAGGMEEQSTESISEQQTEATARQNAEGKPNDDLELLRNMVINRFKRDALTEEDYVEKFNEEYSEEGEKDGLNFLQRQKQIELQLKEELDSCGGLILPGKYCRIKADLKFEPKKILVLGGCLVAENKKIALQGKVVKNKWQKGDLKSNAPQFVSMGWYRFQTIPLFAQEGKAIKYLRGTGGLYAETVFYGPAVPVQTHFFVYSYSGQFRFLASGQILNASGDVTIKKKLKLIGYPKDIMGNTAIIQSMFSSGQEVAQFSNAKLSCASGLRGILKGPIGNAGDFRAAFEGKMAISDIVFIKAFVPMIPHNHMVHTGPAAVYVRSLSELKKQAGLPLYDESISDDSDDTRVDTERHAPLAARAQPSYKEYNKKKLLADLERKLPYDMRSVVVDKETIDLPLSPEQKRAKKIADEIEYQRQLKDAEEQRRIAEKVAKHAQAKEALILEKEERKRKNAIERKREIEMGGRRLKKAHKPSKVKHKK